MMSDLEIYENYSRYAVTVAGINPMPFERWARRRDNPMPFRTWAENELTQEDEELKQQDLHVEPELIPPDSSEIEALQGNVLTLFQQIVSSPPTLTLSDEIPTVDMSIEELSGINLAI